MAINDPKVIFETALTDVKATDIEGVGTLRWGGDGRCYRWVENTDTVALTVGQVAFHDFSDGADYYKKVDSAATADLGAMAGVVVAASLAEAGTATTKYGWIQVLGYTAAFAVTNQETTATAAGATFKGIDTKAYLTEGAALGTAPLYANHIIGLEAVATATTPAETSIKGYIKCL